MSDLIDVIQRLGHPRLLVLGDLMLDRYVWGNAERVSPEAPVLVLRADQQEVRLGGAASVTSLLQALEAEVIPVGVVGDDSSGRLLRQLLQDAGIRIDGVFAENDRPTTAKERLMGRAANRHPHQIVRVDYESRTPISEPLERQLSEFALAELDHCDAVLISDYNKGVCTHELVQSVITEASRRKLPVIVDPARGVEGNRYQGATVLTPNRLEASGLTGVTVESPAEAQQAGLQLCRDWNLASALVTLDREGIVLAHRAGSAQHYPTRPREVYDITGAGDMVLAVAGLCLASRIDLPATVQLANLAAGLAVERLGVSSVSRGELRRELTKSHSSDEDKILSFEALIERVAEHRRCGRSIVFTNGCFDLLHVGHTSSLREAASFGDVLIVAVNSDRTVSQLKGAGRPLNNECQRAAVLAALGCVDHVLIFDEVTPHRLLRALRPDVLVKGGTYALEEVVGHEIVRAYGGEVRVTTATAGVSTTQLLHQIQTQETAHVATDHH